MTKIEEFPPTLKPETTEVYTIDGKDVHIPVAHLVFTKWAGDQISNTFGNKGLIDYEGAPMFAELAIQRTVVKGGWNARWVETYAMKGKIPYYFTEWGDGPLRQQVLNPIEDSLQVNLLAEIANNNNSSYSGCWDVLAWRGDRSIFIESKRLKKDRFQSTQIRWLEAGFRSGLTPNNFLIVQWGFVS